MKYLSKNEFKKAIQKASKKSNRDYLILNVLFKTGVRVEELTRITPNDVLSDNDQIIIKGKGDKIRNIDVSPELIMQLELYIKNFKIKKRDSIIPLTTRAIGYITHKHSGVNPHAFRHSYAIHLLQGTRNIRYVQLQLGHEGLSSTEVYLQFMDFEEEKKKLGEIFG